MLKDSKDRPTNIDELILSKLMNIISLLCILIMYVGYVSNYIKLIIN